MRSAFIIFLLFLHSVSLAQGERYSFQNITEKDGFYLAPVTCLLQDKKGYLWFATRQGAGRYDGYSITRFTNEYGNKNTVSGNNIWGLAEDKQGRIWMSASADGLNCYDPVARRFKAFKKGTKGGPELLSSFVMKLHIDSRNRLWIAYVGDGWSVYDLNTGSIRHYKSDKTRINPYGANVANSPTQFIEDKAGGMWIVAYGLHFQDANDNITTYSDNDLSRSAYPENNFISGTDDDSLVWLGTWGAGVKKFNKRTRVFTKYVYDIDNPVATIHNIVCSITRKSNTELWVGTADKGLGILNTVTGKFTFIKHAPQDAASPPPFECYTVFKDRSGILWAGFNNGISRLQTGGNKFRHTTLNDATGEYKNHITPYVFCKDTATNTLFVGCNSGRGLYVINEATGTQHVVQIPGAAYNSSSFRFVNIYSILKRSQNELLVTGNTGIYTFNTATSKFSRLTITDQDGRKLEAAGKLTATRGGYWCNDLSADGFYFINNGLATATHYSTGATSPVKLRHGQADVLLQEHDTLAWISVKGDGLCKLNPVKKTITPVMAAGDRDIYPLGLVKTNTGKLWFTTFDHGVFSAKLTNDTLTNLRQWGEKQGVPSVFTGSIIADADSNIWVNTSKGPIVLKNGGSKFINFELLPSSPGMEYHFSGLYQADNKIIYTGTQREYLQWHPDTVLATSAAPLLQLTSIRLFDREWKDTADLSVIRKMELAYNENFIGVAYNAIDYNAQADIEYAYKMDGVNTDWVYAGNQRSLSYSNLGPGNYLLHIKAYNRRGGGGENELLLPIVINPPFWQRWWFITACALALCSTIVALFRYRLKQVKKEGLIRSEFSKKIAEMELVALRAQMNPHFLFNCLNSINRFIVVNDTIKASGYLTKFSKLIRLILDTSREETTTLATEISLVTLYIEMEIMRFDGRFTYKVEVDEKLPVDTIIIPSMIIQPYIENAIWHGLLNKPTEGKLLLTFKPAGSDALEIIIEDDGIGRQKAMELKSKKALKEKSFGMQITGDRIKTMNQLYNAGASVMVEDVVAENGQAGGTRVILNIPYSRMGMETKISMQL